MSPDDLFGDTEWTDTLHSPDESQWQFLLGLFTVLVVAGYVAIQFATGGFETPFGPTSSVLGIFLGVLLIGEYLSPRFQSVRARGLVLPSIEVLLTYALFGVFLMSVFSGAVTLGVVTGVLLICGFSAIIVTSSRSFEDEANS